MSQTKEAIDALATLTEVEASERQVELLCDLHKRLDALEALAKGALEQARGARLAAVGARADISRQLPDADPYRVFISLLIVAHTAWDGYYESVGATLFLNRVEDIIADAKAQIRLDEGP